MTRDEIEEKTINQKNKYQIRYKKNNKTLLYFGMPM